MTFNIYGCCVSREPIEALMRKRDDVSVNQYVAFINPIALCSNKNTRKINIDELNDLQTSNFRKRNLCLDINGSAFDYLFAKESDYIVIDTWDFRQPMIEKDGCYITIDPTTIKRNAKINEKFGWNDHSHIFHDQITDDQYDAAIDELCRRVLQHYKPEQIILMESYGVQNYYDEKNKKINFYKQADLDALDKVNARAKDNFERLYKNFGNCHRIEFPKDNKVYGASDAKWGIMFLHYWSLYYDYAADAISIAVRGLSDIEEKKLMEELKSKYESDADMKTSGAIIIPRIGNEEIKTNNAVEISHMNRDEKIEEIQNTRDFNVYLDCLNSLQNDFLIVVSTRHTPGSKMVDNILKKIHDLGFSDFDKAHLMMYSGVASRGNILFNKRSEKGMVPVEFHGRVDGLDLSVISRSWDGGLLSSIKINEEEYSLNGRGINIVVYDLQDNSVIDSCNYDAFTDNPTFFHKNLLFNAEYFKTHFYVRNTYRENWILPFQKRFYSNRMLNVKEIENGIILPNKIINDAAYGGVCTENFEFITGCHSVSQFVSSASRHIVGSYKVSESELKYIDEIVVYAGSLMDHPGHLIMEAFADRIWWYLKNNHSYKYAVVCIWGSEHNFQMEFLKQFGLNENDIIFVDTPTKFKKVIAPDQSVYTLKAVEPLPYEFTKETVCVFDELKQKAPKQDFKKIYFTKSKTQRGNVVGEEFFINYYRKKGFKIINPEDYTLNEKIAFLKNADEFVSIYGTNTVYAVFCKPTVKLTVLARDEQIKTDMQAYCNEIAGIKECYLVDISMNFLDNHNFVYGLMLVGATVCFKEYAKTYFGETLEVSSESYEKYLCEYICRVPKFYSSNSMAFEIVKNKKMLDVFKNISEIFLDTEFDTSGLDLTTEEDKLRSQVKKLTAELDKAKKCISELEESDAYKAAKLIEATSTKLEKQITKFHEAIQSVKDIQAKAYELSIKNAELECSLLNAEYAVKQQKKDYELLLEKAKEETERAFSEKNELQDRIDEYECSSSWRITKPMRSIARFFRSLFGKK